MIGADTGHLLIEQVLPTPPMTLTHEQPEHGEAGIAGMLSLVIGPDPMWSAGDLAGLLTHQWAACLATDLEGVGGASAEQVRELGDGASPPIRTFADLLWHPRPPLELLRLAKDFAKAAPTHPARPLPEELAKVVYLAALAAARRSGVSISRQQPAIISQGAAWAMAEPWVDGRTRELMRCLVAPPA